MSEHQPAPPAPPELGRGRFQTPRPPLTDPLLDGMVQAGDLGESGGMELGELGGFPEANGTPRPAKASTAASSPGDSDRVTTPAVLARTLAGGLLIVAAAVKLALRWMGGTRELRPPSRAELGEITVPSARIILRHTDAAFDSVLLQDLADGCLAATGLVDYLESDPLTRRRPPDPAPAAAAEPSEA